MNRRQLLVLGLGLQVLVGCGTGDEHRRVHNAADAAPEASTGGTGSGGIGAGGAADAGTGGSVDAGSGGVRDAAIDVSNPGSGGTAGNDASIDASPDATADAAVDAGSCQAAPGTIDQEQLLNNGILGLRTSQVIGQSFTAGATGQLTGIEIPLSWYDCTPPTQTISGSIDFTLSDGVTTLAAKSISFDSFGSRCSNVALASGSPGVFYIDLSNACVHVVSGAEYTFTFTPQVPVGACNGTTCTAGLIGDTCDFDQECDVSFGLGEQSSGDPYPGGTAISNGGPIPTIDLNFRTFVR